MKKLLILLFTLTLGLSSFGQYMNKWYGIKYDPTATSPAVTRIAEDDDLTIHNNVNLPIQNLMVGCLLLDNGVVNYYLNPTDWTLKATGGASNQTGTDGQVMVEIPSHYELFETVAGWNYAKFSLTYKAGFKYVPKMYVSAYKAALNRTTLKLSSVINTTDTYRGADNSNAVYNGMPVTAISRTNFRTYAQNRGANWSMMSYQAWKTTYWLYIIEYATRNSQAAVGVPDGSGYQTGGLGNGLTTLVNWAGNGYRPVAPCGLSNSLGNGSGEVAFLTTVLITNENVKIPRYRGIESPFGDIWEWMDGISIYHSVTPRASYAYIIDNPNYFSDGAVNLGKARAVVSLSTTSGWVSSITFGSYGDPLPSAVGGGPAYFWCDYFYTPQPVGSASWYAPFVGGLAYDEAAAGFGFVYSDSGASVAAAYLGSRLVFTGS